MTSPKTKANIGLTLVILFVITLATGIILHLKKHGTVIEPRAVIKVIHWVAGFAMVGFACWHGLQFRKMLNALKTKFRWFWCDTWVTVVFIGFTFLTGSVKLLSPVKIPHIGLWHYWFGIIMSVSIVVHLVRGIPGWKRMRGIRTTKTA